jgi:hypothetical protein
MHLTTEKHGDMSCEIEVNKTEDHYIGTLKFRIFEVGLISNTDVDAVRAQFQAICELVDAGGMIRLGIIMLGYHNSAFRGDVLLVDGEIIGEWSSDDEEWCHFTATDAVEVTCSAPSPWLLHDSIADWLERGDDTSEQ